MAGESGTILNDEIVWSGIGLPVLKRSGGYFAARSEEDLIWSSLLMILGTRKGSRVMLPEFGAGVIDSVFDPNDEVLHDAIRTALQNDVTRWDPRINILEVNVAAGGASGSDETHLQIAVRFSIRGREGYTTRGVSLRQNSFV